MSSMYSEVALGELILLKNDKSKQLKSNEYLRSGCLPIVDQSKDLICGYTNDLGKRFDKGLPVTIFGDHTLHVKFVDFDFAIGADGTQIISCKESEGNDKYLYYLIKYASSLIASHGYSRHFKILKEFCIPFTPALPEQQKIASILTSVDTVIEKTEAQINKLKDLKKAMMRELLTRGIGHTKFKDSPVGRIPVEWEVWTVNDLITNGALSSIQDGNHGAQHPREEDYASEGVPFIMASDITDGILDYNSARKIPFNIYKKLRIGFSISGDVLLTHKATIGLTAIVPKQTKEIMLTPQVTYYRVKDSSKLLNTYLFYWFQSDWFQESMSIFSAQSTRSYIGITGQKKLLIVLPPTDEQQKLSCFLNSADTHINKKQNILQHTKSLKKALMQDLLTGKVRVAV